MTLAMTSAPRPIGHHLRDWRQRRRLSQLDLALDAEISARHLSFLETGRAAPSREMVLRLAEQLEVPLRDRNQLLLAAGFAPVFAERALDDPALAPAREAVERLLAAHDPWPALAVDRHWTLQAANPAARRLMAGLPAALLGPPTNVLRVSLHPDGLAPRIVNLAEWRGHLLSRLRRQAGAAGDPVLVALIAELQAYPGGEAEIDPTAGALAAPLRLAVDGTVLSFLSATLMFGAPQDVTLSELAVEIFLPADPATAEALRARAAA
ncbi:putative transcriptional regulator [Caulobacter sp. AP07]|uniref:helix-turn-helix domain-containing protein n=1 Tax=Caulobacter sp. AP07 TaxID=1144304 RepID=UPI000271EDA9|nr:helix-turn-helix transcriptional regulator [Caulobacter sp. AP07]EJL32888.1 putative transcriptional regulator [Caulobacter sp. AP07]